MTTRQITLSDAVLVAFDIAKARNEVLIEIPGRQRRRKLSIRNTRDDHDSLVALLLEMGKTVICGFEATGNYLRPIAWRLIWYVVGRKVSKARLLADIYQTAQASIALPILEWTLFHRTAGGWV